MSKVLVLNPFTIDPDAHSNEHVIHCEDASLTVQSDVQQSDINFIVRQFGLTHELPYGMQVPEFVDYSDIPNDYHQAMMYVQESQEAFMRMPAEIRTRFENDAGRFVAFVNDPSNYDSAIEMGLVPRRSPPAEPAEKPVPSDDMASPKPASKEAAGGS